MSTNILPNNKITYGLKLTKEETWTNRPSHLNLVGGLLLGAVASYKLNQHQQTNKQLEKGAQHENLFQETKKEVLDNRMIERLWEESKVWHNTSEMIAKINLFKDYRHIPGVTLKINKIIINVKSYFK